MKTRERADARRLRREDGLSVREITDLLGVAKSSVSRWVRDIELTEAQHQRLLDRNVAYNRQLTGTAVMCARRRAERLACQEEGRALARRGEPLHAAGCMLYWAEGSKSRNCVALTNADPDVLRFFLSFLTRYFDFEHEKLRVSCNLFADHLERQRDVEDFWLALFELPRTCLHRSAVNVYSKYSQRKRKNMLPYGTCRLSLGSTAILQHIFGAIQEYGGFDRPEWLG